MAEALLESDESTASLSEASMDGEIFEESQSLSSVPFLNPRASSFKPRNRRRGTRDSGIIAPPPGFSSPLCSALLSPSLLCDLPKGGWVSQHVALDCESKFSKSWQHRSSASSHVSFYVQWSAWAQEERGLSWHEFRWWTISDDACSTPLSESRKELPIIGIISRESRSLICRRRAP
jgi:hypothetical protein